MPAIDLCHDKVVNALAKEGWSVANAPLRVGLRPRMVFIDLEVHRNSDRQQALLIEVKCFPDRDSTTQDLYGAIGQYLIYRALLRRLENETPLYLAIPQDIYLTVFDATVTQVVRESSIKLVIIELEKEAVVQWIE